jgi:hypothetical protein
VPDATGIDSLPRGLDAHQGDLRETLEVLAVQVEGNLEWL